MLIGDNDVGIQLPIKVYAYCSEGRIAPVARSVWAAGIAQEVVDFDLRHRRARGLYWNIWGKTYIYIYYIIYIYIYTGNK